MILGKHAPRGSEPAPQCEEAGTEVNLSPIVPKALPSEAVRDMSVDDCEAEWSSPRSSRAALRRAAKKGSRFDLADRNRREASHKPCLGTVAEEGSEQRTNSATYKQPTNSTTEGANPHNNVTRGC